MNFLDRFFYVLGYERLSTPAQPVIAVPQPIEYTAVVPQTMQIPPELQIVNSYPVPISDTQKNIPPEFQKNTIQEKTALAQDPMYMAMQRLQVADQGLRKPTKVTFITLRRMSRANWVDRTCITTLRDEITAVPWDVIPIEPKKSYSEGFRQYLIDLLKKPNRNNENWRTFIDKVMEDILVLDAGCIEKVRDQKGRLVELWYVDGGTIKPIFDEYGVVGNPAYQQYFPTSSPGKPVAEFLNDDLMYMMWNPQGANDVYGYGISPVEAGLSVGTAFLYAEAYNMGFFNQNTIPTTIINMGKAVPTGQVEAFKSFLLNEMQGIGGFWKPIVGSFGEGFSVNPVMKTPADLALKEYVEWQMKWKVALYRMSPQDIGFTLDQYKAEGQVQQQLSKNKAISSLKRVIEDYINREVLGDEGWGVSFREMNLHFQWVDTVTIDPLQQAKIDDLYVKNGTLTINEIRQERFGKDPIVGGQKSYIAQGTNILPLDSTPLDEAIDQEADEDDEDTEKNFKKKFVPEEGTIQSLATNQTAILWMDDRGVTQPLFVTDFGKTYGFTIKPNFLDERKEQEPPEATMAKLLRLLKVNTPEVKIMSYDDVVRLLPTNKYPDFTKWINLEAPYDSQEWRQRWGDTRMSKYYIVTGFISGQDLNNEELQKAMALSPESYKESIKDFARIYLAEKKFFLGDRKPGHYIVTNSKNGFGVDYQFFNDEDSWNRTSHWLPDSLEEINPALKVYFDKCIAEEFINFNFLEKAFRGRIDDGETIHLPEDIEKRMAVIYQKAIYKWYKKAVRVISETRSTFLKNFEYQSTQLNIPAAEAQPIIDFVNNIPEEKLSKDPNDSYKGAQTGRELQPHVTVLFGLTNKIDENDVARIVEDTLPITITLGRTALFSNKDYDVLKIDISSPALMVLNKRLAAGFATPGQKFDEYKPHLTLAYLKKGEGQNYINDNRFEGKKITINNVTLSATNEKMIDIPLGKKELKKAQPDFDPKQNYITDGTYVYQNGIKYSAGVLSKASLPGKADLLVNAATYRSAFTYGAAQAELEIKPNLPQGMKLSNPDIYVPMFEKRANLIAETADKTLRKQMDDILATGFEQDMTYGEVADSLAGLFGVTLGDSDFPGWRAMRIARTETMWAINEGMRQQYEEAGIKKVNMSIALTACDLCVDAANGNPYSIEDANDLLPIHPNCRCVLVGDFDEILKYYVKKNATFRKGWVTIRGRHIFIGGGGGSKKAANVPGIQYRRSEGLTSNEGAPDKGRVEGYKQLIQSGHEVAPLLIRRESNGSFGIEDGKHRFQAYRELGHGLVPVIHYETRTPQQMRAYDRATAQDNAALQNM